MIFSLGTQANAYALRHNKNAMHMVRFFSETSGTEQIEYWVCTENQGYTEFNRNLRNFMSDLIDCGFLIQYQRVDFE